MTSIGAHLTMPSRAPQLDLLHVQMCARAPPPQHKIMQYPIIWTTFIFLAGHANYYIILFLHKITGAPSRMLSRHGKKQINVHSLAQQYSHNVRWSISTVNLRNNQRYDQFCGFLSLPFPGKSLPSSLAHHSELEPLVRMTCSLVRSTFTSISHLGPPPDKAPGYYFAPSQWSLHHILYIISVIVDCKLGMWIIDFVEG